MASYITFLIVKASPASSSSSSPSSFLLLLSFFFSYLCSLRYETGKRFFMCHDDECLRRAIWSVILSLSLSLLFLQSTPMMTRTTGREAPPPSSRGAGRPGAPQSASEEIRLCSKRVRFTADARPHLWPMRDGRTDGREAKDVMSDAMRPAGRT